MSRSADLLGELPRELTGLGSVVDGIDVDGVERIRLTPSDSRAATIDVRLEPLRYEVHAGTLRISGSVHGEWVRSAVGVITNVAVYGIRTYRRPRWAERVVVGPDEPSRWFLGPRAELSEVPPWGVLERRSDDRTLERTYLFRGMESLFSG